MKFLQVSLNFLDEKSIWIIIPPKKFNSKLKYEKKNANIIPIHTVGKFLQFPAE